MRGIEPLKRLRDGERADLWAGDNPTGSIEGLRSTVRAARVALPFSPAIFQIERRRHQPGRFACCNDRDMVTRQTIGETASERVPDETKRIDTADTCTQNLLQVST